MQSGEPNTEAPIQIAPAAGSGASPLAVSALAGSGNIGIPVIVTKPSALLRHEISDEQLDMLGERHYEGIIDWKWAMLGAFWAALPPSVEAIWNAYLSTSHMEISPLHLTEIALCISSGVLFLALKKISDVDSSNRRDLKEEIRQQPRH